MMTVVAGATYQGPNSLIEDKDMVEQTQEVKTKARLLMRLPVDMETGVRGLYGRSQEAVNRAYRMGIP